MKSHHRFVAATVVCLFILIGPAARAASDGIGAIFMMDGKKYEHVEYSVNREFRIVTAILPTERRNLSFSDIAAMYDESGNDVTEKFLGAPSRQVLPVTPADQGTNIRIAPSGEPTTTAVPERKRVFAKTWDVAFRLGGNLSFPIGEYYEGFSGGVGYEGDLLVACTREIALRASLSRSGAHLTDNELTQYGVGSRILRYSLAIQYYRSIHYGYPDRGFWYSWVGAGAVSHTLTGVDYSETKFFMPVGFGVTPMLNPWLGLDLSSSMDVVFVGSRSNDDQYYGAYGNVQTALLWDLRIGLIAFIPKH
jgi:hypothetical protein